MNIKVNNVNLYYEVQGKGNPLILLHGNRENNKILKAILTIVVNQHTSDFQNNIMANIIGNGIMPNMK